MSIFNSLKPNGGQRLNPFDISRRDVYSCKSGVLNVNLCLHTIPESKYEVNHASLLRTDAIQTASFARMTENFEYYFVPYSQLWHDFERMYYERGDQQRNGQNVSYSDNAPSSSMAPVFRYKSVFQFLLKHYITSRMFMKMREQSSKFADYLLRYYYQHHFSIGAIGTDTFIFDVHGELCVDESIKLFDMLGYGNLYPIFHSIIDPFFAYDATSNDAIDEFINSISSDFADIASGVSDLYVYSGVSGNPTWVDLASQTVDVWRDNAFLQNWNSLFDALMGLDVIVDYGNGYTDKYVSVFPLAAYTKVFSDIYRNSNYDTANYSALFNYDYVVNDSLAVITDGKIYALLLPHFRQYKKDIFTGGFPNAQFGAVAVSSLQSPSTLTVLNARSDSPYALYQRSGVHDGKVLLSSGSTPSATSSYPALFDINSGVSALAVRQALSLQRYKERILRAGNRLTSLQNAVFGDRSRFLEDSYVQFIGAEHSQIDFNTVAATSDAGNSEVGQLGQNGVGTHFGKAFEFHSHDFGLILGIHYILPESEYEAFGLDPFVTKSETNDYYKPDFMNLGLSPVMNYYFNFIGRQTGSDAVLSYLANYWEYKAAIDKVHGNFYASVPESVVTTDLDPRQTDTYKIPNYDAYTRGENANFVTPRSAAAYTTELTLGSLYVNPHDIDSIFYVNSDFRLTTDQFKCNSNHDIKALLPMSVVGLPEF